MAVKKPTPQQVNLEYCFDRLSAKKIMLAYKLLVPDKTWMKLKYWLNGSKPWTFSTRVKDKQGNVRLYELIRACSIGIVRHVKIKGEANPFDPLYDTYFKRRRFNRTYGHRTCLA